MAGEPAEALIVKEDAHFPSCDDVMQEAKKATGVLVQACNQVNGRMYLYIESTAKEKLEIAKQIAIRAGYQFVEEIMPNTL